MRELGLESAELLPSRETLQVIRWHPGHRAPITTIITTIITTTAAGSR